MKGKCTRGFGIITDPETGDEINVEGTFEVSEPVFQRLRETYPGVEQVVDPPDESVKDDLPNYNSMPYSELRQLASDADTDEIDGRSSKDEILAYFTE